MKYYFNTTFYFFSFIYVFLSINIDLAAQESVTLGAQENLVLRANQLDYFVDRVGVADHAAVISGKYDSFFKEVSQDIYYKPPVNVNYWVRFRLKNTDYE
ncbi:MAG: hypothetical protein ACTHJT_04960 [Cytophaga sp.]|uniref:hypothetical protein n=1 Tax=Cytophaga sp. TaxID=29535 RepID=UPI003F7D0D4A